MSEPATPPRIPKIDWPLVAMGGLVLAAIVALVWLGQELSAVVGGVVLLAGLLGYNTIQHAVSKEQTAQVKELANGNLSAERQRTQEALTQAAEDRRLMLTQLMAQQQLMLQMAAMLPANTRLPVLDSTATEAGDRAGHR